MVLKKVLGILELDLTPLKSVFLCLWQGVDQAFTE